MRIARSTVKIGAAAWMTAARPESIRVSAKLSSQYGSALFSAPSTAIGTSIALSPETPPVR